MLFVLVPLPFISNTCCVMVGPLAVWEVVVPVSNIHIPIDMYHTSKALSLVCLPLPFIYRSVFPNHDTKSFALVLLIERSRIRATTSNRNSSAVP
jgi:hypothetical protein